MSRTTRRTHVAKVERAVRKQQRKVAALRRDERGYTPEPRWAR